MDSLSEALKQVFVKPFNAKYLFLFFILFAAEILLTYALGFALSFLIALALVQDSSILALAIVCFSGIVIIALYLLVLVLVGGIGLNIARDYLQGKEFSIQKAFEKSKPRFQSAFFQQVIFLIILLVFFAIVFFPLVSAILDSLLWQGVSAQFSMDSLVSSILEAAGQDALAFVAGILVSVLAALIFIPAIILLRQVVFFEKVSAIESIKRCLKLGFKNFLTTYAFIIIFAIVVIVGTVIGSIISENIAIAGNNSDSLYLAFSFLVSIGVQFWNSAIALLFAVKVYDLNVSKTPETVAEEKKPVRKFAGKKKK